MYSLTKFSLSDMTECGATLRKMGSESTNMEGIANKLVQHFYGHFQNPTTGANELALVRFFKTHAYGALPHRLQHIATDLMAGIRTRPDMKCLTLLATAGDRPEWNQRTASKEHQVIPLPSEQIVAQAPMIAQLIQQLGLSISDILFPDPNLLMDLSERTFNVFHIPEAEGSPYIPAQAEFVQPFQIKSVVGFGGILPCGNLMTIILFSKVMIQRETAELFKPLALNTKMAILPKTQGPFFTS